MISWIQRYFHKHFRWVFALVLIAMALPLVVIFSPSSGVGRTGGKIREQSFFGVNLRNDEQARRVFADGSLSAQLKAGYNALQGGQLQQYSLQRVAGLAMADELHLPVPTADQVAKYVTTLRAFQNEQGQFDPKRYSAFGDSLKTGVQLTTADVNRILRDDARLEELNRVAGGPGYVLPNDIKQQLIRADTTWSVQVAITDYATFNPAINPGEEALKKFYEDNPSGYDVPARPRISYVEFKGSAFPQPVAPTEAELRAFYNSNPAAFPVPPEADKDKKPAVPAAPVDNFPKVRALVETAIRNSASARLASKAANDLTVALFERKATLPANSPELAAYLESRHLPVVAVPPFAPRNPPADKPWLANYSEQITRLNKDRYFSDPVPTMDSFVVLLWNENLPAYKPLYPEVRERVAADYKEREKRRLFNERGRTLRTQLQAAAKTAGGFAATVAAEKLELQTFANISLRQPAENVPQQIFNTVSGMEAGQVADMVTSPEDKGYLVFVQEKKLPDLTPGNPRYAELQKQLMAFTAGSSQNAYLGELVARELKKSSPADTP